MIPVPTSKESMSTSQKCAGLEVVELYGDMETNIGLTHEEAYRCG
jgi:hypothetical protein